MFFRHLRLKADCDYLAPAPPVTSLSRKLIQLTYGPRDSLIPTNCLMLTTSLLKWCLVALKEVNYTSTVIWTSRLVCLFIDKCNSISCLLTAGHTWSHITVQTLNPYVTRTGNRIVQSFAGMKLIFHSNALIFNDITLIITQNKTSAKQAAASLHHLLISQSVIDWITHPFISQRCLMEEGRLF